MEVGNIIIKWFHSVAKTDLGLNRSTNCTVTIKHPSEVASNLGFSIGIAWCSNRDHFSKETGRKLSLQRALKDSILCKDERKTIWEAYRNMKPNKRW